MKKNVFSENNDKKSSKGFYAALGISAVMIGSACWFAYDEGKKLNDKPASENVITIPEAPVDNKATGVPKITTVTTTAARTTPVITTHTFVTAAVTTVPKLTIPAADIIATGEKPAETTAAPATTKPKKPSSSEGSVTIGATKLENPKKPLADVSKVLNPFSGSELVKNETTGSWQTHNGIDYAAEVGAEVYAISSGEIVQIVSDPLWGVTVTVNHHNGFISKYCSLSEELSVQKGDTIAGGDVIGVVAQTADIESAVAPHLHLELQHNGSYVDPASFF